MTDCENGAVSTMPYVPCSMVTDSPVFILDAQENAEGGGGEDLPSGAKRLPSGPSSGAEGRYWAREEEEEEEEEEEDEERRGGGQSVNSTYANLTTFTTTNPSSHANLTSITTTTTSLTPFDNPFCINSLPHPLAPPSALQYTTTFSVSSVVCNPALRFCSTFPHGRGRGCCWTLAAATRRPGNTWTSGASATTPWRGGGATSIPTCRASSRGRSDPRLRQAAADIRDAHRPFRAFHKPDEKNKR